MSDHEGFSDLYRIELADERSRSITRLATGVSGITALSPAMSVAQRNGRVLFSVFENTGYNIYGLDADKARGQRVELSPEPAKVAAELLPPVEAFGSGLVAEYLTVAITGFPTARSRFKGGL